MLGLLPFFRDERDIQPQPQLQRRHYLLILSVRASVYSL
ncbi:hypothetical protein TGAM01_v209851 [Trichoderma gamsii]|uniref:Uncharacterized protein n=1 Tax=Trichoderma gamsii TaxID=398673 RepID=A0A2P4ZAD0_9HYPO|nr:hypothetical protein TGAM01_v209851 [Trichoderma gamsii]PON21260.1 hypothetical protein TGAM01_v209851 [Trichoderma gamsii]